MLSHVVATTNLQNKKNSFHNIWCVQKIIPIFAQQKNRNAPDATTYKHRGQV
jgi:hypothetical protein